MDDFQGKLAVSFKNANFQGGYLIWPKFSLAVKLFYLDLLYPESTGLLNIPNVFGFYKNIA
jgi:hypothetical protein